MTKTNSFTTQTIPNDLNQQHMKKILVIEDNSEVRENLEEVLELYGYDVESAENGKIGVEKALEVSPDLILCDVMMPELDGFGVLNILSKKPTTSDTPFIFLTAKSEKEDFRRGMNLGADDYVTKPFYKDELLQVIDTRIKKSERLKKRMNGGGGGLSAFINEAKGYEELKKLSSDQRKKSFHKKDLIFEEHDYPRYLYLINKGKVKIFKTNEHGKEYIIEIFKEGEFFGYIDLIKDTNYSESAAALEETELSLIPKEDFTKLLHANRDVASRFIKFLANDIAEKEEQLLNLAYNSVRKRVADALLLIYDRYVQEGNKEIQFLRDDLARVVGTAKESVIRMLTEFRMDGYIDIVDGKIIVLDPERLKAMPG